MRASQVQEGLEKGSQLSRMELTEDGLSQSTDPPQPVPWASGEGQEALVSGHDSKQGSWLCPHSPRHKGLPFRGPPSPGPLQGQGLSSWAMLLAGKSRTCFHGGQGHIKMGRAGQGRAPRANQMCHVSKGWISHKLY